MICSICGDELLVTDQDQPVHLEHVVELREEIARLNGVIAHRGVLQGVNSIDQQKRDLALAHGYAAVAAEEGAAELAESHDAHLEDHPPRNSRADEFTDQTALD